MKFCERPLKGGWWLGDPVPPIKSEVSKGLIRPPLPTQNICQVQGKMKKDASTSMANI